MNRLFAKVLFTGKIELLSGMHIGGSSDFSPIGAVDSVIIRDPLSMQPIIPASSLKGKLRYLLARSMSTTGALGALDSEAVEIKRLFGGEAKDKSQIAARVQFQDLFLTPESAQMLMRADSDLFMSEIKFENTIDRRTGMAMPRQQERALRGSVFALKFVYNVEDLNELEDDINRISEALKMLELDYLGGSGTRGYGRVAVNIERAEVMFGESSVRELVALAVEPLCEMVK